MNEKLGEDLTIDDIARAATFSKFHFTRVFQQATGVSPGRFLSALRLDEAKRLLLTTSITVADISHRVGYNSVGTFSTRFSSRVGLSPSAYRQQGGFHHRPTGEPRTGVKPAIVRGFVSAPPEISPGLVFVGLFPTRIPEGAPVRYTVIDAPGPYQLTEVPEGTWHLVAHCVTGPLTRRGTGYTGYYGPITLEPGVTARLADLRVRPKRMFDPPVLLALPDLRHRPEPFKHAA
ncbi:AraC family transcriptional regulator [Amycolatopsis sp. lyj-112]|uniref:AraC family transcriptional regulator n=1 Tax=Amycolatopsis sp. lyj-112 TaxID=2789288 RepID=UPI0039788685